MSASEERLPGGCINDVVRVGDTVRRPCGERAAFVHRLLEHLGEWEGAPRFLGIDEQGREILDFVEGQVLWGTNELSGATSPESLRMVAQLVRELHDLTAGSDLAGGEEVVCHNDLSPKNTVYRDDGDGYRPVAIIDWDIAAPGRRIHDVAHTCWQYVGLGPHHPDATQAGHTMRLMCDAYGLTDRSEVLDTVLWWQDRCWRGIEAKAEAGEPAMIRLRDNGASAEVRAAYKWVDTHRADLRSALD